MKWTEPSMKLETLTPPGWLLVGHMPPSPSRHRKVLVWYVTIGGRIRGKRWAYTCFSQASV